jgi:hypothetical protein
VVGEKRGRVEEVPDPRGRVRTDVAAAFLLDHDRLAGVERLGDARLDHEDPRQARIATDDRVGVRDDDRPPLHAVAGVAADVVGAAVDDPPLELFEQVGGRRRRRVQPFAEGPFVHASGEAGRTHKRSGAPLLYVSRERVGMSGDLPRQRFVLDTSLFITEEIRRDGESLAAAVRRLLDLVATARLELNISCYVPPSIHDELVTMLRDRDVDEEVFSRLDTWVVRKSPDRYGVSIPANVVYNFIDEMSDRVDRGLRVSEEALREVEQLDPADLTVDDPSEYMTAADRALSNLRDKYRRALRQGVLDSREDFDLLVLARELDAGVVTEDRGIISWADEFGLRYVRGGQFPTLLEEYLRATGAREPGE